MKNVVLTGGIASGKTQVASFFASFDPRVGIIDCDAITANLYEQGNAGYEALVELLGRDITLNGKIDKPKLRAKVFKNPKLKAKLEDLIHPLIRKKIKLELANLAKEKVYSIIQIPLYFETVKKPKYYSSQKMDFIVVCDCIVATQVSRAKMRGLSHKEVLAIIDSQASRKLRLAHSDFIIDTEQSLTSVKRQAMEIHRHLMAPN